MTITVHPWFCPVCDGTGHWSDGPCLHCNGCGVTGDVAGWAADELRAVPRPPGVMPNPCVGCAYRPGSPEQEWGPAPPADAPFWCHQGMPHGHRGYAPPVMYSGRDGRAFPVGALVCAGWWATLHGGDTDGLPDFRDDGKEHHGDGHD